MDKLAGWIITICASLLLCWLITVEFGMPWWVAVLLGVGIIGIARGLDVKD